MTSDSETPTTSQEKVHLAAERARIRPWGCVLAFVGIVATVVGFIFSSVVIMNPSADWTTSDSVQVLFPFVTAALALCGLGWWLFDVVRYFRFVRQVEQLQPEEREEIRRILSE